jgi:integrase
MKLTKDTVRKLKLSPGKADSIHFDEDLPGFGIRLRAGGKRTWLVQYRVGAKQRRVTLGTVKHLDGSGTLDPDEAREVARKRLAKVTLGGDPQKDKHEARAKAALTLGAMVDRYLAVKEASVRKRTFDETQRYLTEHWKSLHGLPVHEIHGRDIAAQLAKITTESGTVSAARARAALSGLFAWAVGEGILESNPVIGTNKPPESDSRKRVLTDTEIAEVWAASRDDDFGRIVKLLLLTACRREEIGGLKWEEIDLDGAVIHLPGAPTKNGEARTKNGEAHDIPLTPLAMSIIGTVPRHEGRDYLFGDGPRRADGEPKGFSGWSKAKAALDARILAARQQTAQKAHKPDDKVQPMAFRIHDLRRTAATGMARLRVLPHVIESALNHISGHKAGVAGIYNRETYKPEVKAALTLWSDHIRSVTEGGEPKVGPDAQGIEPVPA